MRQHAKGCLHSLLKLAAVVAVIVILMNVVFRLIFVDGESMQPTLMDGDWIVACRFAEPKYGDIVLTDTHNELHARLIKRLIAKGGDTVDIDFETGTVYVNGEALNEAYLADREIRGGNMEFPLTVPEGTVFLLGDNRTNSVDSRYSELGFVDEQSVIGPVWLRVLPLPIHYLGGNYGL